MEAGAATEFRRASPADGDAWNDFVRASPDSTYGHSWEWLDLYQRHGLAQRIALLAIKGEQIAGAYGGLLASGPNTPVTNLLIGARILWSPHELTWDYGGPVFGPTLRLGVAHGLVAAMEKEARAQGARCLRISPFSERVAQLLSAEGYERRERLTSLVSLGRNEGDLWETLHKSFRYDVRKAEGLGLKFEVGFGPGILGDFYNCIGPLADHKGFELPPRPFFAELLGQRSGTLECQWNAVRTEGGRALAVGISICYKRSLTERWAAATPEGKRLRANHYRIWQNIVWATNQGFETYDLGGLPSDPSNEIYRFKSKIGGEAKPVDWYVKYLRLRKVVAVGRRVTGALATPR